MPLAPHRRIRTQAKCFFFNYFPKGKNQNTVQSEGAPWFPIIALAELRWPSEEKPLIQSGVCSDSRWHGTLLAPATTEENGGRCSPSSQEASKEMAVPCHWPTSQVRFWAGQQHLGSHFQRTIAPHAGPSGEMNKWSDTFCSFALCSFVFCWWVTEDIDEKQRQGSRKLSMVWIPEHLRIWILLRMLSHVKCFKAFYICLWVRPHSKPLTGEEMANHVHNIQLIDCSVLNPMPGAVGAHASEQISRGLCHVDYQWGRHWLLSDTPLQTPIFLRKAWW